MESTRFKLQELVPANLYNTIHESLLWDMLDDSLLKAIDRLKEVFPKGTITINSWMWGGDRGWSGIRTIGSPWYSQGSMHSQGKALDMVFSRYTAEEVRQYILANQDEFPGITRLEGDVSWLHIDTKFTGKDSIYVFHV